MAKIAQRITTNEVTITQLFFGESGNSSVTDSSSEELSGSAFANGKRGTEYEIITKDSTIINARTISGTGTSTNTDLPKFQKYSTGNASNDNNNTATSLKNALHAHSKLTATSSSPTSKCLSLYGGTAQSCPEIFSLQLQSLQLPFKNV